MNKKTVLMILGAALVACACCVVVIAVALALGFGLTEPAATAVESFMTALKNGDYAQAYALCAPSLQQEVGTPRGLQVAITNAKAQPKQWTFTSRNVSGDEGQLDGTATFASGREGTVRIVVQKVGNEWKVSGYNWNFK